MRLTIIPIDGTVSEDGKAYNNLDLSKCGIPSDVHALQWDGAAGWVEFTSPLIQNEPITQLPAWANACIAKWNEANVPKPPEPPSAEQNKQLAIAKLQETDWTTFPDVTDPLKSNPYLANAQDFVTYRNSVRQHAIYPKAGDIDWAVVPPEVWKTV